MAESSAADGRTGPAVAVGASASGVTLAPIVPQWPAPPSVHALSTTRAGGCSDGPYAGLNLSERGGDRAAAVLANRALLRVLLPGDPLWVRQVHGTRAVELPGAAGAEADAVWTGTSATVCAILTADCLPVLFCDRAGTRVAAAHAGWRGLAAGVLESTVAALGRPASDLLAWLGPAIGQAAFEVGPEVRAAFLAHDPGAAAAFEPGKRDRWHADLHALARRRLAALGLRDVYGGGWCTWSDAGRFYSFRRDASGGRMATLIWLGAPV